MEEIFNNIDSCIDTYDSLEDKLVFNDLQVLHGLIKTLSNNMFYLEAYRDEYKRKHDKAYKSHFDQGTGKAKVLADIEVPEIYMIRRKMESAKVCWESMRSNASYLKNEK